MMSTSTEPPLVSILMPMRNAESTLRCAIESILWQTERRWELIVIDDGSIDGSQKIASHFADQDNRIHLVDNIRQRGVAGSLNTGLDVAGGQFIARMDGDDVSHPGRLETQLRFLNDNPTVDLVGTAILAMSAKGAVVGRYDSDSGTLLHEQLCPRPWAGIPIAHPTWLMRTAWLQRHRYAGSSLLMEDQELLLRAMRASRYAKLPTVLLVYEERRNLGRMLRMRVRHLATGVSHAARTKSAADFLMFTCSQGARALADVAFACTRYNGFRSRVQGPPVNPDAGLLEAITLFRSCRRPSSGTYRIVDI